MSSLAVVRLPEVPDNLGEILLWIALAYIALQLILTALEPLIDAALEYLRQR